MLSAAVIFRVATSSAPATIIDHVTAARPG